MAGGEKPPKKLVIAVCGGLNWDLIMIAPQIPVSGECLNAEVFEELPGGKGANAAIALYRLTHVKPSSEPVYADSERVADEGGEHGFGPEPRNAFEDIGMPEVEVRMIGAVGVDRSDNRRGIRMKTWLRDNWVNVDLIEEREGVRSAVAFSMVENDTGANRALICPGANHIQTPQEFVHVDSLGTPRPDLIVLQLELQRETVSRILRLAQEEGIETLLNPAPGHYLPSDVYKGLTHLIVNETEAAIMSGKRSNAFTPSPEEPPFDDWISVTDYFLRRGVKNVVVTLEDKGAFFSKELGKGFAVPAVHVPEPADTTGAGDTFVGGYVTEWLRQKHLGAEWDPEAAVKHANRSSAIIIQKVGCQEAIPWASDFEESKPVAVTPEDAQPPQDLPVAHDLPVIHDLPIVQPLPASALE